MKKTSRGTIEFTPTELHNYKNDWAEEVQKHSLPSPETKKLIKTLMDNQNLVVKMFEDFKEDFKSFRRDNKEQHEKIIKRQDHTNGDVSKLKKGQLILWTATITAFTVLAIIGFLPTRIYEVLAKII